VFACHAKVRRGIDEGSDKVHSLLSRAPSTRVLVNGRSIRNPPRSYALSDPLKVFNVLPSETLVLLDKLHECGRLVISKDDVRLLL